SFARIDHRAAALQLPEWTGRDPAHNRSGDHGSGRVPPVAGDLSYASRRAARIHEADRREKRSRRVELEFPRKSLHAALKNTRIHSCRSGIRLFLVTDG